MHDEPWVAGGDEVVTVGTAAGAGAAIGAGAVGRIQAVPRRMAPGGQGVGISMIGACGTAGAPCGREAPERASLCRSSGESCL